MLPTKVLTPRGYSIEKSSLSAEDLSLIKKKLIVTPKVPKNYANTVRPFQVYLESATRYYLPNSWASNKFGRNIDDIRAMGSALPVGLKFKGSLRPHQEEALAAFRAAGRNGIICLPCGYGKTFTGIAAAVSDPEIINTCFIIVVHKEFLANMWKKELTALVPGIRIGRIQGEKCEIGPDVDVAIAMIQTICSRSYPIGTFDRFGLVIFDEVHHLGAEHFSMALQRVNCRRMLGLTATPDRSDGLSKVFEWHIGPIVYQISHRPKDDSVIAETLRYECDDPEFVELPTNYRGETASAHLINRLAEYGPRLAAVLEWVVSLLTEPTRKILVLSDRKALLRGFEAGFRAAGIDSVGYYIGGMKEAALEVSATQRVILGTFAMASEGMNIPTLNMVLLATPRSSIEQSVGRILRQKKEERTVPPMILDILDTAFDQCSRQWNKRSKFYKECGYALRWHGGGAATAEGITETEESRGVALFVEEDESAVAAPAAPAKKSGKKPKRCEAADIISHVTRGNAMFVDEEE